MKKFVYMFAVTSLVGGIASAEIYHDPQGDIFTGNPNLDITQVEITDNGSELFVSITVDSLDADWGKYLFFADYQPGAGSGSNDNPWFRNIEGLEGADYFMGSWLDGGGGAAGYGYDGAGWFDDGSPAVAIDYSTNTITYTIADIVALATDIGESGLFFEVATTGGNGGDPAVDLLGGFGGNWGEGSTGVWTYYEFDTIPAPGALVLLSLAGVRSRRRQ